MFVSTSPLRTMTELDHVRISNLLRQPALKVPGLFHAIDDVIQAADLVSSYDVPADVVTMYSRVKVVDRQTGAQSTLTLCYPHDAEPLSGFVSVLSPVGAALLGLSVGQTARWTGPRGDQASAVIMSLLFQPEESGDYLL